jgi:uncharacterized repeat protein (TIGR02543 family)
MFDTMFEKGKLLTKIDISNWNLSSLTTSDKMFNNLPGLTEITLPGTLKVIGQGFCSNTTKSLQTVEFKHDANTEIQFAEAGMVQSGKFPIPEEPDMYYYDIVGSFYNASSSAKALKVISNNKYVRAYDWEADQWIVSTSQKITYNANNGNFNGSANNTVTYTNRIGVMSETSGTYKVPTRPGYSFSGWYTDTACKVAFDATKVTSDVTVYAKWTPLSKVLLTGSEVNGAIPANTTAIVFTDADAPNNVTTVDLSAKQDGGVLGWSVGTTFKISTQRYETAAVANANSSNMFKNLGLVSNIDFTYLDTSNTTKMQGMFYGTGASTSVTSFTMNANLLDTSKVTTFKQLFYRTAENAKTFDIGDIGNWNTSKVTNMSEMFNEAGEVATTWNVGKLNTKKVTTDSGTSYVAWDTAKVTDMNRMFRCAATKATNFDIGNIGNWNTSKVTNFNRFLAYAAEGSKTVYVGDLSTKSITVDGLGTYTAWDTKSATSFQNMFCFYGANSTSEVNFGNLGTWNTSNVTDMSFMFHFTGKYCPSFYVGNLSNWDTSNVTTMEKMFAQAAYYSSSVNIGDIGNWDVSNVTNMRGIFMLSKYLLGNSTGGDLSSWDLSKVTDTQYMFFGVDNTATLTLPSTLKTIDNCFAAYSTIRNFIFKHGTGDSVTITATPGFTSEGDANTDEDDVLGAFYCSYSRNITVQTANTVIRGYNWTKDNCNVTWQS